MAIVGAGFTGLWTAYYLKSLSPDLHINVLEREIAGFGASGRNGGFVSAGLAGVPTIYARRSGLEAVREAERETNRTIDEIGGIVERERIECNWRKSGQLIIATNAAQHQRLNSWIEAKRFWGAGVDDVRLLDEEELRERVNFIGVVASAYTPHCARVNPAALVRGLARAVQRLGATIYERTPVTSMEPGRVITEAGATVRAKWVVRATESYTVLLPGERRRYLPLYSLMIATEPLKDKVWDRIGWEGGETVRDLRHLLFYAQRTADDRIAAGGRGAPHRMRKPIDDSFECQPQIFKRLKQAIEAHFPLAGEVRITHGWGGPLAVPRDWCQGIGYDRATGFLWGGGYSGHGLVASNLAGRTMADLVLDRRTHLVGMPWVGHEGRRWEPEPLPFLASRAIVGIMRSSDSVERKLSHTARRMRLIKPFIGARV